MRSQNVDMLVVSIWQQKPTDVVGEIFPRSSCLHLVDVTFNFFTWLATSHACKNPLKTKLMLAYGLVTTVIRLRCEGYDNEPTGYIFCSVSRRSGHIYDTTQNTWVSQNTRVRLKWGSTCYDTLWSRTRNLAIANRSRVSYEYNTSRASVVSPWPWNLG